MFSMSQICYTALIDSFTPVCLDKMTGTFAWSCQSGGFIHRATYYVARQVCPCYGSSVEAERMPGAPDLATSVACNAAG
jgi:hypothetical protein